MSGKKGMKHYPVETKLEAVRLYYEEGLAQSEITKRLAIRDPGRVKKWLRQYRQDGAAAIRKKSRGPGKRPKREDKDAYIARLEMENALLKKFNTELRKKEIAKRNIGSSTNTVENTK
jgi:transposase